MFTVRELFEAYPNMSKVLLLELYKEHGQSEALLEKLDEAERQAIEKNEAHEARLRELRKELSASEQHRLLTFLVPAGIDLEHVQAILMYGFLAPGHDRSFIGRKMLPVRNVRKDVQNKLGIGYSKESYDKAFAYLKKEGVFNFFDTGGREEAASLKSNCTEPELGTHGAQILRVALEYLRKNKSKR